MSGPHCSVPPVSTWDSVQAGEVCFLGSSDLVLTTSLLSLSGKGEFRYMKVPTHWKRKKKSLKETYTEEAREKTLLVKCLPTQEFEHLSLNPKTPVKRVWQYICNPVQGNPAGGSLGLVGQGP